MCTHARIPVSFLAFTIGFGIYLSSVPVELSAQQQTQPQQQTQLRPPPTPTRPGFADEASYTTGYRIGQRLKEEGFDYDARMILRGILDGMGDKKAIYSDTTMDKAAEELGRIIEYKFQQRRQALAKTNRAKADSFLRSNASRTGVVTTTSGLQYKVIRNGQGKRPAATDSVKVHYHGLLLTGDVFDSSVQRGTPQEVRLNEVINGWSEALQRMPVGSKWRLYIPPKLAYGEEGTPFIEPNSVLVFDLELLEITTSELPAQK